MIHPRRIPGPRHSTARVITPRVRERVLAEVEAATGIAPSDVLSKEVGVRRIVAARWMAIAKFYTVTGGPDGRRLYSLPEIGRALNRHHASILNAVDQMLACRQPWDGNFKPRERPAHHPLGERDPKMEMVA